MSFGIKVPGQYLSTKLHGITSQKTVTLIFTAVRISNLIRKIFKSGLQVTSNCCTYSFLHLN
jgi:hypothetical protein